MSQDLDEFLEALRTIIESEISYLQNTVEPDIQIIKEQTRKKIKHLEREIHSITLSQTRIDDFQRELSSKQLEWLKRANFEKGRLIDKLIQKLELEFKYLGTGSNAYNLLNKLFHEIKNDAGVDYEVHITNTCDPEKFKAISGIEQNVIADLIRIGVIVKRKDSPIIIENTMESRFEKSKDDLIIEANNELWADLKESPKQLQQFLNRFSSPE